MCGTALSQLSQNEYDWIGHGIYFWEFAPYRAWEWATQKYGADAAVIEAEISIGHSIFSSEDEPGVAEYVFPECETVRAPFLEGIPIFDGSAFLTASHIQIAVRKPLSTIQRIRLASRIEVDEA